MKRTRINSRTFIDQYLYATSHNGEISFALTRIKACDEVLQSVEISLTNFQKDLGVVSAEIETLQSRSTALNTKLDNRKSVEKLLGPAVEEMSIAPTVVKKISEGPIDYTWVKALEDLEMRLKLIDNKIKGSDGILAASDLRPLLEDLTSLVRVFASRYTFWD